MLLKIVFKAALGLLAATEASTLLRASHPVSYWTLSQSNKRVTKRQSESPKCPVSGERSSFFTKTLEYFQFIATRSDLAINSLKELPDDLSDTQSCDPMVDTGSITFYPIPPEGSSDCPRRDQEVRYRLFRAIIDVPKGQTEPYFTQDPSSGLPSDETAITEYCQENTVLFTEFNSVLETLATSYARVLDNVDAQTCLINMNDQSVTAAYTSFIKATASDTGIKGIFHAFDTLLFYATYRGEMLDADGQAIRKRVENRVLQTTRHFENRQKCTAAVKARCEALGVPLQSNALQPILEALKRLGLPVTIECPAKTASTP